MQLQPHSIETSCTSSLSPTITKSSCSKTDFVISAEPVATTTFPRIKYPWSLPVTIFPSIVSTMFLYWVLAVDKIELSYTSMYDIAISPVTMTPSNLFLSLTTGSVTTFKFFIISHAFFIDK